jgi:hypothetical protein
MASLYCILARAADRAVIFRRGPSKLIRLISWNLADNTFEPGQWFAGQIYVRKCDLSPDGRKLVYFAAKHRGPLPTWIAVSTPPYLTAHVLWRGLGTWNDISLFETGSVLALAAYRSDSSIEPEPGFAVPSQLCVKHKPWPGYFHKLADHDRLVRDGWSVTQGDAIYRPNFADAPVIYRRGIGAFGAFLQLAATNNGDVSYQLCCADGSSSELEADWADVHRDCVVFSRQGKLFVIDADHINARAQTNSAVELADFTDMTFEAIQAPEWAVRW